MDLMSERNEAEKLKKDWNILSISYEDSKQGISEKVQNILSCFMSS